MSEDKQPPSPSKLKRLRDQGALPTSGFTVQALGIAATTLALLAFLPEILSTMRMLWQSVLVAESFSVKLSATKILRLILSVFGVGIVAAFVVQLFQSKGFVRAPKPSFSSLTPFQAYKSRLSPDAWWTILSQLIALVPPLWVAVQASRRLLWDLQQVWLRSEDPAWVAGSLLSLHAPAFGKVLWTFALSLGAAGLVDWLVRRRSFLRKHGMDMEELKREYKDQEGGPEKKQAQSEARFLLMSSPPAKAMRAADLVVRNPSHIAVAVAGAFSDDPWILMVGKDRGAQQVLRLARRYQRPQVRSVALARALAAAGEGASVPPEWIHALSEAAYWAHGIAKNEQESDQSM